ncbi:MAG: serine hydrolase domain-containing protein [Chloroflexota bacterium]
MLRVENPSLDHKILFGQPVDFAAVGMNPDGVRRIHDVFQQQLASQEHWAAQLVVLRHGRVVVDVAGGLAHKRSRRLATQDTLFHCFSISKSFTAVCIHHLVEQGKVELDAPIATYWPAFGSKGKETATVRHALLHQSSVPTKGIYGQIRHWPNWARVTKNVAQLRAEFPPGERTAYHLVNNGFILGEIVQRVTGTPIEAYLTEHFLTPMGLYDTSIGLPLARWGEAAHIYCGDLSQRGIAWVFNLPRIRSAVMPASTLNSTARDLAIFFQMLINQGAYDGQRYLQAETIQAATQLYYEGYDGTLEDQTRWGLGFMLGGIKRENQPLGIGMGAKSSLTTIAHYGQNSSMVWGDAAQNLVVAFVTNRLQERDRTIQRFHDVSETVWAALV